MHHTNESRLITLATGIYVVLLYAYPPAFRETFAHEMTQVFHDSCVDAWRRAGNTALWGVWLHTYVDLLATALQERIEQKMIISRLTLIRLSGLATIVGGVVYLVAPLASVFARKAGLGPFYVNYFPVFVCCSLAGLIGMVAIQQKRLGQLAASLSLIGASSGIALLTLNSILLTANPWHNLILLGYGMSGLLCLGSLLATGVIMRQTRPLAHYTSIALLIIGWLIIQIPAYILLGRLANYQTALLVEFVANYLVGCILWCLAGWALWQTKAVSPEKIRIAR